MKSHKNYRTKNLELRKILPTSHRKTILFIEPKIPLEFDYQDKIEKYHNECFDKTNPRGC